MPSTSWMSPRLLLALVALPAAALAACAAGGTGGGTQPASEIGRTEPDAEAPSDGGTGDEASSSSSSSGSSGEAGSDGGSGEPVIGGCRLRRVANADDCDESCDARLKLPGGGSYCTLQCGAPSECNAPASGLACPSDVGACMPRCTSDATCKAMGFARCVVSAGACDTI
ncbi:MAG: hypothetical protein JST00_16830 [Deltaproteobacteria bacterium]|nr:hypothetical protein [Deltaproteobacteria bacterium]